MTELDAWLTWASFEVARAGLFAWLAGNNEDADDDTVIECHEFVMDAIGDADKARTIKAITGKDIRSMSVAEIEELQREIELRKAGGSRN